MIKHYFVQALVRLFYPYGSIRRVVHGPLRGMKFVVAPSMGLTYAFGFDSMNWQFLKTKIRPGQTVYDIGSNRGQMGLFFSKEVGDRGQVYCFEPMGDLSKLIEQNMKVNNITNIDIYPFALSSINGIEKFLYAEANSTQGKLHDVEVSYVPDNTLCVDVETRSLDLLFQNDMLEPQILKIDVEGAAGKVFEGARVILDLLPDIFMELHGPEEQKAIGEHLVPRGYTFYNMEGDIVSDPVKTWCSPIWCTVKD